MTDIQTTDAIAMANTRK